MEILAISRKYEQKFRNREFTDGFMFFIAFVPLKLTENITVSQSTAIVNAILQTY